MWAKWLPWRFVVRHLAKAQGFLDPLTVVARLQRFAQPSEVAAPIELLRSAAVLHARGLMNSQAIQHNLDWIWPYWVEQQFDPKADAFIPRAFSMTHINLTHRNWTALGLPNFSEYPLVDPRGLVTPFYDGWSIDAWVLEENGKELLPSRAAHAAQKLILDGALAVETKTVFGKSSLTSTAKMVLEAGVPTCEIELTGSSDHKAWLVVSLRPYNPEGVSFIHQITLLEKGNGWKVNDKQQVLWDSLPERTLFSEYRLGDVFARVKVLAASIRRAPDELGEKEIKCDVGMATAAALFEIAAGKNRTLTISIPFTDAAKVPGTGAWHLRPASWGESVQGAAKLRIPDQHFSFLYEAALRTLVLHSPREVYPGPYTYKHFWFRDAAFIISALIAAGLLDRAERILDEFPSRQTPLGYFHSQDGEWDSNGEALWILQRFCQWTGRAPKESWRSTISRGGRWIKNKRLAEDPHSPHAGLLPSGFSAEHLGPNDYYYWDDFWGVTGLRAASWFARTFGDEKEAQDFQKEADRFLQSILKSLGTTARRLGRAAMPASPYRRLDTGAIGSLAGGYPLEILEPKDPRLLDTVRFLMDECFVEGAFFHDMSHSGINPYLTLHVAQVLLRAGDPRFRDLMKTIAGLATPTGQWPEAIHPRTRGGCMGDGQHVWAAAEWVLMVRNSFVREEGNSLVLGSGLFPEWYQAERLSFGPAPTAFGTISVTIERLQERGLAPLLQGPGPFPVEDFISVSWTGNWYSGAPRIEVRLPGLEAARPASHQTFVKIPREKKS